MHYKMGRARNIGPHKVGKCGLRPRVRCNGYWFYLKGRRKMYLWVVLRIKAAENPASEGWSLRYVIKPDLDLIDTSRFVPEKDTG